MRPALACILILLAACQPSDGRVITGQALVMDSDTLLVGDTKVLLCGIDSPEPHEPTHIQAKSYLEHLVKRRTVQCLPVGRGTPCDGRTAPRVADSTVAQCFIGGIDVADLLVKQGYAADWLRYSGGYYSR